MRPRRYIVDSTLRDGEQMPGISFTMRQKLKIAALLDQSGIHQIEAGVPATSAQEKELIGKIIEERKNAVVSVWARLAESDIQHAIDVNPDLIHITIPVSHLQIYGKLRKNEAWVISQVCRCLEFAGKSSIPLSVGFEDAFRAEPDFMKRVAKILLDAGVARIRLSDTVGIADPSSCRSLFNDFNKEFGGRAQMGVHAHNDFGMAVANTVEAAKSGCLYNDVTIGGIGERTGNCDFLQLICASDQIFDWGVTPFSAQKLQDDIFGIIGR